LAHLIEAAPEFQGKPAAAPLAWTGQFDVIKAELDRGMFEVGGGCLWAGSPPQAFSEGDPSKIKG
jgi:hypothetical protein